MQDLVFLKTLFIVNALNSFMIAVIFGIFKNNNLTHGFANLDQKFTNLEQKITDLDHKYDRVSGEKRKHTSTKSACYIEGNDFSGSGTLIVIGDQFLVATVRHMIYDNASKKRLNIS